MWDSHHKTVIGNHDFLFFLKKIVKIVVDDHNFKFKPKTNFLDCQMLYVSVIYIYKSSI